ncbi:MAG: enoyl-CoA hydratase-related protein [Halobacteriales archaeon]|nr:enoyl-CoA hydratase-related protein [Halobacteriales archaeon]
MSDEAVLFDITDGVATLTLNRPSTRNAITDEIADGVMDALDEIEELEEDDDKDVRCVVIQGTEGTFCAGGDVNAMMEGLSGMAEPYQKANYVVQKTSRMMERVADFYLPTVAKIDGTAFGAGANLAVACDIQLASDEANIGFGFNQVGLGVDTGTSYLLPRIVGLNKAKELVFTGELLDAEEAEEIGLFNHVYASSEFEEEVDGFVEELATGPTVGLIASKRGLNQAFEQSLHQAMVNEAYAQIAAFESEDHQEGARAFMERREPEFEGE